MIISIIITGLAIISFAATTVYVFQQRGRPNRYPLILLLSSLTTWTVLLGAAQVAKAASVQPAVDGFKTAIVVPVFALPPIWATYALGYAGGKTGVTRRRILLLAGALLPIVFLVGIFAVAALEPPESVGTPLMGGLVVLLLLASLYPLVMVVYGGLKLIRLSQKHASLPTTQVIILLVAVSAPYLGLATEWNNPIGPGVSLGLLAAGVLLSIASRRYPLLSRFPESESIARTRVVESLQEAIVVLNWNGRVLDVNTSFTHLFQQSADAVVGRPITSVIDGIEGEELAAGTTAMTTLLTAKGQRQFEYSVSAVDATTQDDDNEEEYPSRAVAFRDVTDKQTQEQRLKVLNRILRHNVRNRLDVILAHAGHIEAETTKQQVRENATELVELSEKAREAEEIIGASTEPPEKVDLVAIAEQVITECSAAGSSANITVTSPDKLMIMSHRTIVRELLSELVDNAIKHTEQPAPTVSIELHADDMEGAELVVADNGPGIPKQEQAVLKADTETPLKHSKGIGLWFVKWAVSQLGGELSVEPNDPKGSIITARIRDAEFGVD
ncbi:MAG: PAS sensor histidine kinase [Halonotius sp. J07HN4]|nr:MAG: PAS sensor histidine kinase [Halonotius sp. J07HN4]